MSETFEAPQEDDNIEAAMDKVAEDLEPTRVPAGTSKAGDPASKQVLMRASERDHKRWKDAADKQGISMAEFMRNACNEKAATLLDCPHPTNQIRYYPWAVTCLACGTRLSQKKDNFQTNNPTPKKKRPTK